MGIFSDRCDALIDPNTRKALTGEALEKAKLDPKWPRCGTRVSKAARFCRTCGKTAPGGWWRCPSCRRWIGNDAQFCPHCDAPLHPDERAAMSGGVWRKDAGMLAQRFEVGDVKRLLQDGLQIQEGTVAVLLDAGRYHDILASGRHTPDGTLRKINWFGNPPPRTVVMVDSGDVALPLHIEGLRTAEHHPIEFYGETILRFGGDKAAAVSLLANALKEARHMTYGDLAERLQGAIRAAVDELCVSSTLDDLVRDPNRRLRLQETMARAIGEDLGRMGFDLVRVSSAEFTGEAYEAYAERLGELDVKRRELEYAAQMRAILNREAMSKIKDESELAEFEAAAAQELGIAQATRDQEMTLLKRGFAHRNELDELRHAHDVQTRQTEQDINIKVKWDDYNLELVVKTANAAAAKRRVEFAQEKEEAEWALRMREEKDRVEVRKKQADADRRKGMSLEEQMMDVDDPDLRRELLELMKAKRNQAMSPEQLLAEAAANSPAAAAALAAMTDRTRQNAEQFLAEMKQLYADANARQDANLKTMLEPAVEAAKRSAPPPPQTIVH